MVMIAWDEVPSDLWKLPHRLDWLHKGLRGELLPVVSVTSKQDSRSSVLDCEFSKGADRGLARILKQGRNFRLKIHKNFANLEIRRMDQSHVLGRPSG